MIRDNLLIKSLDTLAESLPESQRQEVYVVALDFYVAGYELSSAILTGNRPDHRLTDLKYDLLRYLKAKSGENVRVPFFGLAS